MGTFYSNDASGNQTAYGSNSNSWDFENEKTNVGNVDYL